MRDNVTTVTLLVNGRQAEETLETLKQRADDLREAITNAEESNDLNKVEELNQELSSVNRQIAIINRNVKSVATALDYLSSTCKEEIKEGMDYWREQAETLTIGTEEWDKAFNSYISFRADYNKIISLENNPNELFLHYENEWREQQQLQAQADYEQGLLSYREYRRKLLEIDRDYYAMAKTNSWISKKDAQEYSRQLTIITGQIAQMDQADHKRQQRDDWNERILRIKEEYRIEQETLTQSYENQEITRRAFEEQKYRNEIDYLYRLREVYRENSYDRHRIENQIQQKEHYHQQQKAEEFLLLKKQMEDSYFEDRSEITRKTYDEEYQIAHETLMQIVEEREQILGIQLSNGLIDEKQYKVALEELYRGQSRTEDFIQRKYEQNGKKLTKDYYKEWFGTIRNEMGEEIDGLGKKLTEWTQVVSSIFSTLQQSLTQSVQIELEIQTQAIEKRYDREINLAQGNSYKVKKLEKKKQKELEKARADAQRKTYALQILSTLATTAQNAVSAYGAALQIGGIPGLIMAPIAAAAAVAAGMIQVETIKKQKQAADGAYRKGGYTKKGRADDIAGVVHSGEWVAPKEMVESPHTGPIIENLEQIRTGYTIPNFLIGQARKENPISNTTALIKRETLILSSVISSSDDAVNSLAINQGEQLIELRQQYVLLQLQNQDLSRTLNTVSDTLSRLSDRLEKPFVTVNTITGDLGIKRAQDEYAKLIRNKTPKSRRKFL